ncbi:MAG TPA: glycoside hydrolase family 97 catalytic domain-containing protein [Luteolibacter sp.]
MKTSRSLALLMALGSSAVAAPTVITAPGGELKVTVSVNEAGKLAYAVADGNAPVLAESPLGITVDGDNLGESATLGKATLRRIDEAYPVTGHHMQARGHAVEASVPVTSHGKSYTLEVRAQDDGVAVRYRLPEGAKHLDGESTAWVPASPKNAAWQDFSSCYEANDHMTGWAQVPENKRISGLLTVELPGHHLFLSESNNTNYPDFAFIRTGNTVRPIWYTDAKGFAIDSPARATTPWRTTTIARDLTALVNSDLLTNLCPAPDKTFDFSFVKPGRILWQWCSVGEPKFDDQQVWYDATARMKWEYYMIDDGWRTWKQPGKDQWALLKEVIDYGKTKGIETIIWVDSKELIRSAEARDTYLKKVQDCGAVGIKIDFIPDGSAKVMQWYEDTLRVTAKLRLMTIFHGCTKPTGLVRTWPHALTREGIRGNEWHMTRYKRKQPFDHNVTLPFTRFLAGAGDITPLVADPVQLNGYTLPHMFAQAIVATSPLQCFYDQYKFYLGSPVEDLLRDIPVTWDETRVLPGTEIGKVTAFARRKGNTWWVAVMNGGDPAKLTVSLDFLKQPAKAVQLFDAKDPAAVDRREFTLKPADNIELDLRQGGGFLVRLAPQS